MNDFVRILAEYCLLNNIEFCYGRRDNLNLLQSDLVDGQIYLLHEASPRRAIMNSTNTKLEKVEFIGKFFLVVKSDMDKPYFELSDRIQVPSKYTDNIEPLLNLFTEMGDYFGCTDYEINQWEAIDVVDVFDANRDGLLITYNVTSYDIQ